MRDCIRSLSIYGVLGYFLAGLAGSAVVVAISFVEDFGILIERHKK